MLYLVALISVLCVMNLALMIAVVRRVREQGELLASLPKGRPHAQRLPRGTQVPGFSAVTVTGESRSLADMAGSRSLVGFFAPGCPPCHEQLPEFARLARAIPGGAGQVVAVLAGAESSAAEFFTELDGLAAVVFEQSGGPVTVAFSAPGFPSFYLMDADGRIEASGMAMEMIAVPAPA